MMAVARPSATILNFVRFRCRQERGYSFLVCPDAVCPPRHDCIIFQLVVVYSGNGYGWVQCGIDSHHKQRARIHE